ncbi:hypothetical protein AMTRI_Chr01g112950 [Amborella trichopoda]
MYGGPTTLNGDFHWLYLLDRFPHSIYALRNEGGDLNEFCIELPEGLKGNHELHFSNRHFRMNIAECEGFLSVFSCFHACIEIWKLTDHSKQEWIKKYNFTLHRIVNLAFRPNVVGSVHGGVILVVVRGKLMWFYIKKGNLCLFHGSIANQMH